MNAWRLERGLKALIILLIRTHPAGFRVLLGEYEPPGADEIAEMLTALREELDPEMRMDGGGSSLPEAARMIENVDQVEEIVREAGGWNVIVEAACDWASHYPQAWNIVVDHARWVTSGFSRLDDPQLQWVADKYQVSRETVSRYVQRFPLNLAKMIQMTPSDMWTLCGISLT